MFFINNKPFHIYTLLLCTAVLSSCGGGGGSSSNPDTDSDGIVNSVDVDDDNDGLIEIASLQQLDWIRYDLAGTSLTDNNGNVDSSGCPVGGCNGYELVADLDFDTNGNNIADAGDTYYDYDGDGSNNGWLPIGRLLGTAFAANFNGNGYVIRNLYVNRIAGDAETNGDYSSLFGRVYTIGSITIQNLILEGADITGQTSTGILAGAVDANSGGSVTIHNCRVDGSVAGNNHTGGLIAYALTNSILTNNVSLATVTGTGGLYTGGLIGRIDELFGNQGAIINGSYATGDVTGSDRVGGLIGQVNDSNTDFKVQINNSFATGSVMVTGDYIGGLIGLSYQLDLSDSFATGSVSGNRFVGGLVGDANQQSTITNSFATSIVTGNQDVGALVGWSDGASYTSTYMASGRGATNAIGTNNSGGGVNPTGTTMATLSELQCPITADDTGCVGGTTMYSGWSSSNWDFGSNAQLPGLIINSTVYRDGDGNGVLD